MSQQNHSGQTTSRKSGHPGAVAWLGFLPGPQSGSPSLTLKARGLLAVTGDKELGFALQQTLRGEGWWLQGRQHLEAADIAARTLVLKGGAHSSPWHSVWLRQVADQRHSLCLE